MMAICGFVHRKGRVLMCKRGSGMLFPGFWELPTEVLEEGETAEDAVKREVLEETGVEYAVDHLAVIHENFFNEKILICTVELIKAEKSIMEMSWKGDVRKSPGVD